MLNQPSPGASRTWKRLRLSSIFTLFSLLTGCLASAPRASVDPAINGNEPPTAAASSDWESLATGLERRQFRLDGASALSSFTALRIDPGLYTFRVHYSPGQALNAGQWHAALPNAVAFINANFFDPQDRALGLLVSDGVSHGQTFTGFGGMFQVADGFPRVRSLIYEPYYGETLEQAAQAFPMLLVNGQPNYERLDGDSASRRTIIAQDSAGYIVMIVSNSLFGMRLADLSTALAASDLSLLNALNLDGGGSSMMGLFTPSQSIIPSFDAVPAVIAVYPR